MVKFNYKQITNKIASSAQGTKRINTVMERKFSVAKEGFIEDFNNHEVTQEIESQNSALYGLLGFDREKNPDPVGKVRDVLRGEVVLIGSRLGRAQAEKKIEYKFSVRVPTESIKKASPMNWESGVSWVYAVEKDGGISGFSRFLYGFFDKKKGSRSKRGLQVKGTVRGSEYKGQPYLSELIRKMVSALR